MKISQREARRLQKRIIELEAVIDQQRGSWNNEWPGGVHVDTVKVNDIEYGIANTARKLGHAVVVVPREAQNKTHEFLVYACVLPKS